MVKILASTRTVPELIDGLARRRADGRHTADEWTDEVLHLTAPASPERGEVVARVVACLLPLADSLGLCASTPTAVGVPGHECRIASIAVFDVATPRTTPASLSTADLLVDVVDDGGAGRADRLGFYARWRVREHLEVDLASRSVVLRRAAADGWTEETHSQVLGFDVLGDDTLSSLGGVYRVVWPV